MFLPIGDNVDRREFPYVPAILIILNLFVFAYEIRLVTSSPEYGAERATEFVGDYGLTPTELQKGQVLGLFTHMFLHGSLSHIVGNMIVLWAFALSLEVGLGRWQLLVFYVVWGLVGGITHVAMDHQSSVPLIGASGAIAGVMGAYTVAYGFASKIKALIFLGLRPFVFEIPAVLFGMGWFGMQLWEASHDPSGTMSGIAWGPAHIGGFAAGALTMLLFRDRTDAVLVDVNGRLQFRKREEEAATPVAAGHSEPSVGGQAVLEGLPAPCPYCGNQIQESSETCGPLVRCGTCHGLVFLASPIAAID